MTFTEATKRDADEKFQQLDAGTIPSPITAPEMDSFSQYEQKSKKFHERIAAQDNAVKKAFDTINANKSNRLAAEAAEKKRIEDAALAEKKKKEAEEKARLDEIKRREAAARQRQWEKEERIKKIVIFSLIAIGAIGLILGAIFGIRAIVKNSEAKEYARYSAENIVITIEDKVDATKNSSYTDGYITAFKIKIKNNSVLEILEIKGDMKVYNAAGDLLITTTCTFSGNLAAGEESTFTLNIDNRASEEVIEFYYADCDDLSATFKLTEVIYEDYEGKEYNEDAVSILELSTGSDGISTTEKSYQEAVALFNQAKYSEAMPLFEALGYYKDSNDYYNQCYANVENANKEAKYNNAMSLYSQEKYGEAIDALNEIYGYKDSASKIEEIANAAEDKADELAGAGDYAGACAVLAQLGYDEWSSDMYQAYSYASEGYFADAVRCGLTVVVIPEGTEAIPDNYFQDQYHDYNLQKVVLPSTIKTIGKSAFSGCNRLTDINLPNGLTSIGNSAFSGCSLLKNVTLPNTLQTIGSSAFSGCASMTSVTLPTSLVTLGNYAYSSCSMLSTLTVPGNVKTISDSAFMNCTVLTNVSLGNGVEKIEAYAFKGCTILSSISLPASLTSIGQEAFYNCSSLSEITIPANVTSIGQYVFVGCSALNKVYFVNTEGWKNNKVWSASDMDYKIIDVTDEERNATRFKSTMNYYDATWTREQE